MARRNRLLQTWVILRSSPTFSKLSFHGFGDREHTRLPHPIENQHGDGSRAGKYFRKIYLCKIKSCLNLNIFIFSVKQIWGNGCHLQRRIENQGGSWRQIQTSFATRQSFQKSGFIRRSSPGRNVRLLAGQRWEWVVFICSTTRTILNFFFKFSHSSNSQSLQSVCQATRQETRPLRLSSITYHGVSWRDFECSCQVEKQVHGWV